MFEDCFCGVSTGSMMLLLVFAHVPKVWVSAVRGFCGIYMGVLRSWRVSHSFHEGLVARELFFSGFLRKAAQIGFVKGLGDS